MFKIHTPRCRLTVRTMLGSRAVEAHTSEDYAVCIFCIEGKENENCSPYTLITCYQTTCTRWYNQEDCNRLKYGCFLWNNILNALTLRTCRNLHHNSACHISDINALKECLTLSYSAKWVIDNPFISSGTINVYRK
jgi:hypothetical protein